MPFHFGSATGKGWRHERFNSDFGRTERHHQRKALTRNIVPGWLPRDQVFEKWIKNMCRKVATEFAPRNNRRRVPRARAGGGHGLRERSTIDDRRDEPEHESAEALLRARSSRWDFTDPSVYRLQALASRVQRMEPGADDGSRGREIL
jgi:hypothetical protein